MWCIVCKSLVSRYDPARDCVFYFANSKAIDLDFLADCWVSDVHADTRIFYHLCTLLCELLNNLLRILARANNLKANTIHHYLELNHLVVSPFLNGPDRIQTDSTGSRII